MRRLRPSGWLAAGVLLAAGCGGPARRAPEPPLRFVAGRWPGHYPGIIAASTGIFDREGVHVILEGAEHAHASRDLEADFAAGRLDIIELSIGDALNLLRASAGSRVILVTDQSEGGDAIVARRGLQRVEDLKGGRLGLALGSGGEIFVESMLAAHGMQSDQVSLTAVDARDVPARLAAGGLDAAYTWEPFLTEAMREGARVLYSSRETPGLLPTVLIARGEVLADRPDDVRRFVRGWFKGLDALKADTASAIRIAAHALGLDTTAISLRGLRLLSLEDNRQQFAPAPDGSPGPLQRTAGIYVEFFARIGTITARPDLSARLDGSFLEAGSLPR